mgnify:CR=1 FL=1
MASFAASHAIDNGVTPKSLAALASAPAASRTVTGSRSAQCVAQWSAVAPAGGPGLPSSVPRLTTPVAPRSAMKLSIPEKSTNRLSGLTPDPVAPRPICLLPPLVFTTTVAEETVTWKRGDAPAGALLPIFYAAAPIGLDTGIDWIAQRRRSWNAVTAKKVFSAALIAYAVLLGFFVYRGRVIGPDWGNPIWNQSDRVYAAIGQWLHARGELDPIVMVNNPPGFTYQSGLPAIVVPYGDETNLLRAADQFGVRWLVLDENRPELLASVYAEPDASERLKLRARFGTVIMLEIMPD